MSYIPAFNMALLQRVQVQHDPSKHKITGKDCEPNFAMPSQTDPVQTMSVSAGRLASNIATPVLYAPASSARWSRSKVS